MAPFSRRQRLLAEVLGTAMLLATVIGSGIMGERLAGGNVAIALLANTLATGAILVVLGFIRLAHRQRKRAAATLREMANGNEQLRSERKAELAQQQRKAKRAEQTKDRRSV